MVPSSLAFHYHINTLAHSHIDPIASFDKLMIYSLHSIIISTHWPILTLIPIASFDKLRTRLLRLFHQPRLNIRTDPDRRKIYQRGEDKGTVNVIGIMDTHAKDHDTHQNSCKEKIHLDRLLFCTQEIKPDTCHVAAEEKVFG